MAAKSGDDGEDGGGSETGAGAGAGPGVGEVEVTREEDGVVGASARLRTGFMIGQGKAKKR